MKSLILKLIETANLFSLFNRYTKNSGTIFMLHRFHAEGHEGDDDMSTGVLRKLLGYLKQNKYNVMSLSDYIDALREHRQTYKTVVFTVDDGFRDFYLHAYPVVKEFGYPATIFLTSDFIERKLFFWWNKIEYAVATTQKSQISVPEIGDDIFQLNGESQRQKVAEQITNSLKPLANDEKLAIIDRFVEALGVDLSGQPTGFYAPLTWDEILEMKENGIDFHPHTKTHPIMTRIPYEEKLKEVSESKELLESKLGKPLDIFCYPNGGPDDFDEETIEVLKKAGYTSAVTGMPGFENTGADTDLFRIRRFAIPTRSGWFKQYVSGLERFKS